MTIEEKIRKRFKSNEFAVIREVPNAAGYSGSRTADFVAFNLWPSRGHALHVLEVKASRADWIRELKSPEKSAPNFENCDYFWLVTTDEKIATMEEVPSEWGWLTATNTSLKVMKNAPKQMRKKWSESFVASLLGRQLRNWEDDISYMVNERVKGRKAQIRAEEEAFAAKRNYTQIQRMKDDIDRLEAQRHTLYEGNKKMTEILTGDPHGRYHSHQVVAAIEFLNMIDTDPDFLTHLQGFSSAVKGLSDSLSRRNE